MANRSTKFLASRQRVGVGNAVDAYPPTKTSENVMSKTPLDLASEFGKRLRNGDVRVLSEKDGDSELQKTYDELSALESELKKEFPSI